MELVIMWNIDCSLVCNPLEKYLVISIADMAHTRTVDDTPISQLSGVLGSSIPQAIRHSADLSLERIGINPRRTERLK